MTWVENGRFEQKINGIEAELLCGPFGGVVETKTVLRDRFAPPAAPSGPPRTPEAPYLPSLGLPISQVNIVEGCRARWHVNRFGSLVTRAGSFVKGPEESP